MPESLVDELVGLLRIRDWHDDPDERRPIMREIVRRARNGETTIDPLLELLKHDDWAVRDHAALLLGFIQDEKAVQPLMEFLGDEEFEGIRHCAASALERIGTPEALAAAGQWYHDSGISVDDRLDQKVLEFDLYGETDPELMKRMNTLAKARGVELDQIAAYCGVYRRVEDTSERESMGITVTLSQKELAYLKDCIPRI